jgi:very-short-patch-repair endonuclease
MIELLVNHWPVLFVIATIVAALYISLGLRQKSLPYERRPSLLTKTELAFFRSLQEAVDGQWMIATMVRMADLIRVRADTPKSQSWRNRIHAKHIDFLLCDHGTMQAKLAVELDDASHQRPDRVRRDKFVNAALDSAGIPLLRIDVQDNYNTDDLRKRISEQLS